MERRMPEAALDDPQYYEDYHWLRVIAGRSVEQLVDVLARKNPLPPTDSGRKPGEMDDEAERRVATLGRVQAAQVVAALFAEVATDVTAGEAATAVWLGASLADLGSASGSTRQAARKRWPDLGQIYRMRRWLSGHYEDVFHIADSLVRVRARVAPKYHVTQTTVSTAFDLLIEELAEVRSDFGSGQMVVEGATSNDRIIRWQRLGALIEKRIHLVVDLIIATDEESEFAIEGAKGMLAHYDAINLTPSR